MSTLQAALAYARQDYPVLPLLPGTKRPHPRLVPHGLRQASVDPATLEAWWRSCPRCGVGLLPPEPVLVLDFDDPEAWEKLRREHPALEAAPRQRTASGGYHVFLLLPQGVRLSATTRKLPGVDIRGMGRAYVVVWPTRLADGRTYAWEVPLTPPEELPPVPEGFLLRLLPPPPPPPPEVRPDAGGASPKRLQALLRSYAEAVARAPVGTRHLTLIAYARAAGGLVPHGLDPREAEEVLMSAALQAGLPEREAREAVKWGLEVGSAQPIALEPPLAPYEPRTYRARVYARMRRWA